jgi:hypothetical protein
VKQEFTLPIPVDHIFPGTSDTVLAITGDDSKLLVIGTAMGEVRASEPLEGKVLSFVPFDTGAGYEGTKGFVIITQSRETSLVNPHMLSIFFTRYGKGGFTLEKTFQTSVPIGLKQPAMSLNFQSMPSFIVAWNRTLDPKQSASYYTRLDGSDVWDEHNIPKFYPYELLDIGYGQFMLALYPHNNAISLMDVRKGVAGAMIAVEGLSFDDPNHFAVCVPGAASDGTGSVIVANERTELLTVLPVLKTHLPRIGSPLQISLKRSLDAIRRGKRQLLVTADRGLSFILVGAVGSNHLGVFRKIRGGLEEVEPIVLDKPIRAMIVVHGPKNTDPEVFVFLNDNRQEITVVHEISKLGKAKPADAGVTTTPPPELRLNHGDTAQIQRVLAASGYQVGAIDGIIGPRTESAIRAFQLDNNLKVSGTVDLPTFVALNNTLGKLERNDRSFASQRKDYAEFLKKEIDGVDAERLLTLGVSREDPRHPCFGLNTLPPKELWHGSVAFARVLKRLEEDFGLNVQIVSGYRNPAYNRCIGGSPASNHLRFEAFDIRLADAESADRLMEALTQMDELRGKLQVLGRSVHVDVGRANADPD